MTAQTQRDIVIEFEKVRIIRKRAKTSVASCPECRLEVDVVTLIEATELFEVAHEDLLQFARQNKCHSHVGDDDRIYLCVPSLLESIRHRTGTRRLNDRGEHE